MEQKLMRHEACTIVGGTEVKLSLDNEHRNHCVVNRGEGLTTIDIGDDIRRSCWQRGDIDGRKCRSGGYSRGSCCTMKEDAGDKNGPHAGRHFLLPTFGVEEAEVGLAASTARGMIPVGVTAGSGQKQIGAELVEEGSSGIREQRGPARKRKQRVMVVGVAAGKEAMAVGTAGGRDNWAAAEGAAGSEGRRCSLRYFGSKGRRQWRKARLGARSRGCNKRCTSPPILLAAEEIRLPSILAVGSTGEEAEDTSSLHREKRTKERSPWQEERTRKIVAGGSEGQRENRCSHRFAVD
ncbi:hypothetical protein BHM03_00046460 [Ensete ventricosum]|nr:hypothetical protein BHM03_00046460 [Ensete ventricosum]